MNSIADAPVTPPIKTVASRWSRILSACICALTLSSAAVGQIVAPRGSEAGYPQEELDRLNRQSAA